MIVPWLLDAGYLLRLKRVRGRAISAAVIAVPAPITTKHVVGPQRGVRAAAASEPPRPETRISRPLDASRASGAAVRFRADEARRHPAVGVAPEYTVSKRGRKVCPPPFYLSVKR